jgi:hypothetical protein
MVFTYHCSYYFIKIKKFFVFADESFLTNGYLDTVIDWIPGIRSIRLRDFPSFVQTIDPNDVIFNFVIEAVERSS